MKFIVSFIIFLKYLISFEKLCFIFASFSLFFSSLFLFLSSTELCFNIVLAVFKSIFLYLFESSLTSIVLRVKVKLNKENIADKYPIHSLKTRIKS